MPDILVVSDSRAVVDEVEAALGAPDTRIRVVRTGYEVVPAAHEELPDLVVLDQQIGNMGAMACCLALRLEESADRLGHAPVLVLLDRRADVFLARRTGADGWVMKPLDPIRLRRASQALLDGGVFHDDTGRPHDTVPPVPAAASGDVG